jgi:hypothetical protein
LICSQTARPGRLPATRSHRDLSQPGIVPERGHPTVQRMHERRPKADDPEHLWRGRYRDRFLRCHRYGT